ALATVAAAAPKPHGTGCSTGSENVHGDRSGPSAGAAAAAARLSEDAGRAIAGRRNGPVATYIDLPPPAALAAVAAYGHRGRERCDHAASERAAGRIAARAPTAADRLREDARAVFAERSDMRCAAARSHRYFAACPSIASEPAEPHIDRS